MLSLSNEDFIQQSLELNLFFLRIFKEHAFFLESAFLPRDQGLAKQADAFKCEFTVLLTDAIMLSDGAVSPEVLASGELVTEFTYDAERATEFLTGSRLDPELTHQELSIDKHGNPSINVLLLDQICDLNQKATAAATALADYKAQILKEVSSCQVHTFNYPSVIAHMLRETRFYLNTLGQLQNRQTVNIITNIIEQEKFWNPTMAEHAKTVRGLLDPSEPILFESANYFGKVFDYLTKQTNDLTEQTTMLPDLSLKSLEATTFFRSFNANTTEGLLNCSIKALSSPLFADHLLREANHYLRLLRTFEARLQ